MSTSVQPTLPTNVRHAFDLPSRWCTGPLPAVLHAVSFSVGWFRHQSNIPTSMASFCISSLCHMKSELGHVEEVHQTHHVRGLDLGCKQCQPELDDTRGTNIGVSPSCFCGSERSLAMVSVLRTSLECGSEYSGGCSRGHLCN
jgi:hypothetical protein